MVERIMGSIPSVVNLTETFVTVANNVLCRAAFGRRYSGQGGINLIVLFKRFAEMMGVVAIRDVVPWLGWIDRLNGLDHKVGKLAKEFDAILKLTLEEHLDRLTTEGNGSETETKENVKDFVDVLLEVQRDDAVGFPVDRESIKALILDRHFWRWWQVFPLFSATPLVEENYGETKREEEERIKKKQLSLL